MHDSDNCLFENKYWSLIFPRIFQVIVFRKIFITFLADFPIIIWKVFCLFARRGSRKTLKGGRSRTNSLLSGALPTFRAARLLRARPSGGGRRPRRPPPCIRAFPMPLSPTLLLSPPDDSVCYFDAPVSLCRGSPCPAPAGHRTVTWASSRRGRPKGTLVKNFVVN